MSGGPAKSTPKDAQVMSAILKDMGVLESEPRLVNQMLEFTYRYVTDVLDDAKIYSNHANRKSVDAEDVKLSVQMKVDHSFTTPPPRDLLLEIARQKNSQPLPLVKPYSGPRLPPDRYCLTAPNYKLKPTKKPRGIQYGLPMSQRIGLNTQVKSLNSPGLTVVSKTLTQPSVAILNRQASTTAAKPTIRVTPGIGAIGASSLTRIISGGPSQSNSSLIAHPPPPSSGSTGSTAPSTAINPLKRKLDDDDDYDNI